MTSAASDAAAATPPDVVRACLEMTAAGVAVAVLPSGLHVGAMLALRALQGEGLALAAEEAPGMAQVVLLCTLVAGVYVLGAGLRAAWRARLTLRTHGFVGAWIAIAVATLVVWCWPPFWYFTTIWMFVGSTLATRPLWWAGASAGPVDADDARTHRRYALALAAGITLLSHIAVWTTVIATSVGVPADEFARVAAIRRGDPVEPREWEREALERGDASGGLDFIEMVTDGGAVAAGRYVGGHWSFSQLSVGIWPMVAQSWIAPAPEGPTYAESWLIAALAFVLSLVFWLPWVLVWTWLGARRHHRLARTPAAT